MKIKLNCQWAIYLLCALSSTFLWSQQSTKKGTINLIWGWNSEYYSNSKIHFWGDGYDFKIYDVEAVDKYLPIALNPHFTPDRITIPQTNFRFGYFIKDNIELSVGVDHMKYVMVQNQNVVIDGYIHNGSEFDNDFKQDTITLTEDFLQFEHTDGLNYGNIELSYFKRINPWLKIPNNKYFNIDMYLGFGGGPLIPRTNAKLWNQERNDTFHLAGFGLGGKIGFNFEILRWIILRYEWKIGYINMPNISTTQFKSDRAAQAFTFYENYFAFGVQHHF